MKKMISASIFTLALTLGGATFAHGNMGFERGHGGHGSHHMMKRMFSKLDLTQAQQAAINTIREQSHDAIEAHHDSLEGDDRSQIGDSMKALIQADAFDEEAFRALMAQKQAQMSEVMVIKAKMKNEVWNVLTPEQQDKFNQMMEKRAKRSHRWGNERSQ